MARPHFPSVDAYFAALPEDVRPVLERVRGTLRSALPDAEEVISYQIPALKVNGRCVLYFAGYRDHTSIYPATGLREALGDELDRYLSGKATLRFPIDEPLPVELIRRVALSRAAPPGAAPRRRRG